MDIDDMTKPLEPNEIKEIVQRYIRYYGDAENALANAVHDYCEGSMPEIVVLECLASEVKNKKVQKALKKD